MKISGIYQIQSKVKPERIYIGSAVDIYRRWSDHKYGLKNGNHGNGRLQNHYNKYGESDLIYSILCGCEKEFLLLNEQFYIDAYNPWFNICIKAGSRFGIKHTKEAIDKIKDKRKNQIITSETGRKISKANIGKHSMKRSDETKRKLSIANKGKKRSPEYCQWQSFHSKGRSHKPHSEETKRKIGLKSIGRTHMLGRKVSEESKQKMRLAKIGKKQTLEHRLNLSKSIKGRKMSNEFKQKIKDSWIVRKQNKIAS